MENQMEQFQSKSVPRHLLISGIGRSGTTLLVQYFTILGMDTGYTEEEILTEIDPISHAGLELVHDICSDDAPYVIKAPALCDSLEESLKSECAIINGIVIPIRKLSDAAASRKRVFDEAERLGLDPINHPGSIWMYSDYNEQEKCLSEKFYNLIHVLTKYRIPMYFVEFPKFAYDHEHLYDSIEPLLSIHGISFTESLEANSRVVNTSLINNFDSPATQEP